MIHIPKNLIHYTVYFLTIVGVAGLYCNGLTGLRLFSGKDLLLVERVGRGIWLLRERLFLAERLEFLESSNL